MRFSSGKLIIANLSKSTVQASGASEERKYPFWGKNVTIFSPFNYTHIQFVQSQIVYFHFGGLNRWSYGREHCHLIELQQEVAIMVDLVLKHKIQPRQMLVTS